MRSVHIHRPMYGLWCLCMCVRVWMSLHTCYHIENIAIWPQQQNENCAQLSNKIMVKWAMVMVVVMDINSLWHNQILVYFATSTYKQVTHGINLAAKTSKLALNELGLLNNVNFGKHKLNHSLHNKVLTDFTLLYYSTLLAATLYTFFVFFFSLFSQNTSYLHYFCSIASRLCHPYLYSIHIIGMNADERIRFTISSNRYSNLI